MILSGSSPWKLRFTEVHPCIAASRLIFKVPSHPLIVAIVAGLVSQTSETEEFHFRIFTRSVSTYGAFLPWGGSE